MGTPKALLKFGTETLIERAVRCLAAICDPIVVVAAPDQRLPTLVAEVVHDPIEGKGPLQAIALGLAALEARAERAFVCATDAPFLTAAFVRRMRALAEDHDIAVVRDGGHLQPLAAIYRTQLARRAEALLESGHADASSLLDEPRVRIVTRGELLADADLRAVDPELLALRNVNTPEEYREALMLFDKSGSG
jgi:molybdopterin-guanine dinucleotide biosynthesis protein A